MNAAFRPYEAATTAPAPLIGHHGIVTSRELEVWAGGLYRVPNPAVAP